LRFSCGVAFSLRAAIAAFCLYGWTSSIAVLPAVAIHLHPYSRRSIGLVKRLAGSPKGAVIPTCYANKVFMSARILIYMDGLLSIIKRAQPLLSYLLPYSQRSIY
jgi:hypothetical protein